MSGTSIIEAIENKMADLIEGINAEPYNFVWGPSNTLDMAKASYPSASIFLESENNVDDVAGTWSQAYFNEPTYRIEVKARLDAEYGDPVREIRALLYKALDDLKMLFGKNWSLEGACNTILYRGCEIIEEKSGDIFIPSKLITRWLVTYEQDRLNPTQHVQ